METFKVNQTGPQVQQALNDAENAYQKPTGGIPATDTSEDVQQDLTAAASALWCRLTPSSLLKSRRSTRSFTRRPELLPQA